MKPTRTWRRRRAARVGLTPRGWGLGVLVLSLGVAWYLLRLHLIMEAALLLAATLAIALLVALVLVAVNLVRRSPPELGVLGSPRVGERALITIAPKCALPGFFPAWVLWRVEPGGGGLARTPLDEGRSALAASAARRGLAPVEALGLEVIEPLGLAWARLPLGVGLSLLVLPQLKPLPQALPLPRASLNPGGRLGLNGEERVGSLRDYRPGDALASVHWKQSARLDHLVVTEPEHEARPQASLALVIHPASYARPEHFEAAVSLVAGVIDTWGREHQGIDLLLLARTPVGAPRSARAVAVVDDAAEQPCPQTGEEWMVLRYCGHDHQAPALQRVLALLEPTDASDLAALSALVARHEPSFAAGPHSPMHSGMQSGMHSGIQPFSGPLRADVVLAPSLYSAGDLALDHPPLDPSARGTLVALGEAAGQAQEKRAVQAGSVPANWRLLEAPLSVIPVGRQP